MSDTESDEDLRRAVALSLQQSPSPPIQNAVVIDLTSEDEDDDLDAPVIARQSRASESTKVADSSIPRHPTHVVASTLDADKVNHEDSEEKAAAVDTKQSAVADALSMPKSQSIFQGLNRKKMEEERLARVNQINKAAEKRLEEAKKVNKRKRSITPPSPGQNRRQAKVNKASTTSQPVGEAKVSSQDVEGFTLVDIKPLTPRDSLSGNVILQSSRSMPQNGLADPHGSHSGVNQQQLLGLPGIQFPDGIVKKTWAYGYTRQDDIKIEEVLQKRDLELAVLSAYQVDSDWIMSKLDITTKVIWVLQAKDESQRANFRSGAPSKFRFCFPSMEGNINCMHSKLQLLAHPTHLRIVVPSANLVPYDWGEAGGVVENTVFLIDLPRLPEGRITSFEQLTFFGKELLYFTKAIGLDEGTITSIRKFDFSRTAHLAFVHSIGGSHSGIDWKRTGYCGLGTAVRNLGLDTEEAIAIDFVTSSIGSLNDSFIKSMYLAAQGDNGLTEYRWRTNKASKSKMGSASDIVSERQISDGLEKRFRIYFPTHNTVVQSKGGRGAGGTICFQKKWYDTDAFPHSLMRDCKSERKGMLMHSKILFARPYKPLFLGSDEGRQYAAWAYVGSANLSESAWGRLVKDKMTKEPKLNCRNWECGVIIPILVDTASRRGQSNTGGSSTEQECPPSMEVFSGRVPVPMVVPGEAYGNRRPWFYSEQ